MTRKNIVGIGFILLSSLFSLSCTGFIKALPGGPKMSDATFDCVKTGPVKNLVDLISQSGAIQSQTSGVQAPLTDIAFLTLTTLLKGSDAVTNLGVLMPCTLQGSTDPRWLFCTNQFAAKCSDIPVMSQCHFNGQPLGLGVLWKPSRLTADGFND